MESKNRIVSLMSPRSRDAARGLFLGVDGGGTKTNAVIIDDRQRVLGKGLAGPSNPLRVGIQNAATAIRDAIDKACAEAGVERARIVAAKIGLAGVRRGDLRVRMREALTGLGLGVVEVVTDADIALFGATGGAPGVVVIAGTGSICCGANARGQHFCSGGWGPLAGDEGSGSWIARRALQAVAQASDGRGPQTALTQAALSYFEAATMDELALAIYAPSMTNERVAGLCRHVIEAAQAEDEVARSIVVAAGHELGAAAVAVINSLRMNREQFQVAYVGGVFAAGRLVLDPLCEEITQVAPAAEVVQPHLPPAIAAARMAQEQLHHLPLAV
jgi:N-acetylglucosamine kinase-like BadF-type ATPase